MPAITIIRAETPQIEEVWRIVSEYYEAVGVVARENRNEVVDAYLRDTLSGFWLAKADGQVVGCIALKPLAALGSAGEVKRLYVQPEWRGRGIAEALLQALTAYAQTRGCQWLYLDSKDDLEAAIRFYRRQGYEPCPRYNDNPQATVFMRRYIGH
jgi:GNAT superfamily N-acetyltransferase